MKNKNKIIVSVFIISFVTCGTYFINLYFDKLAIEKCVFNIEQAINNKNVDAIIKNINQFEEKSKNKNEVTKYKYELVKLTYENYDYYDQNVNLLEELNNYKESKDLLINLKYNYAMSIKNTDENTAYNILLSIEDFKNSKQFLENYKIKHKYDGTYFYVSGNNIENATESNESSRILINGLDKETSYIDYGYFLSDTHVGGTYYYQGRGRTRTIKMTCNDKLDTCKIIYLTTVDENGYYKNVLNSNAKNIYRIDTIKFKNNLIYIKHHYAKKLYNFDKDSTSIYKKLNDSTELPKESKPTDYPKEPKIGMTKEEVERSTWGYPNKKNKDTYSWGIKEQWVYDKGYIYFENGIVTSISER